MPSSMVMMQPPGSLPGMRRFAIAPTTRPIAQVMRTPVIDMAAKLTSVRAQRKRNYRRVAGGADKGVSHEAFVACVAADGVTKACADDEPHAVVDLVFLAVHAHDERARHHET